MNRIQIYKHLARLDVKAIEVGPVRTSFFYQGLFYDVPNIVIEENTDINDLIKFQNDLRYTT